MSKHFDLVVIKRDGRTEDFDFTKIKGAILGCFKSNGNPTPDYESDLYSHIHDKLTKLKKKKIDVEDIQDIVVKSIKKFDKAIAISYQEYRDMRAKSRDLRVNGDKYATFFDILSGKENDVTKENSNKDAKVIYTKRDLFAGMQSRDIWEKFMVSPEALRLHKEGAIHIHDTDYRAMKSITNCSIFNLKDMLDNGTVINGKKITSPKSLRTATTIATQIVMGIGNMQYGGITMSIAHLAPYVEKSRKKIWREVTTLANSLIKGGSYTSTDIDKEVERLLRIEVKDSMQTLQYQLNSMTANSGQSPFITVWMDVNECDTQQLREDTALLITELVNQRIEGMYSETGHKISPAFPKLIYVLDENNVKEGAEFFDVTKVCAKCSSKRLTPDYISGKIMRDLKEGGLTPAMGCVDKDEVVVYKYCDTIYTESFLRFWNNMASIFTVMEQESKGSYYIDLKGVQILDRGKFVECKRIVKNLNNEGCLNIKFSNGRMLTCTTDHPLPINGERVYAKDVKIGDTAYKSVLQPCSDKTKSSKKELIKAWVLGVVMCDGCYDRQFSATFDTLTEQDIIHDYVESIKALGVPKEAIEIVNRTRGVRGNYTEIKVMLSHTCNKTNYPNYFNNIFGGKQKIYRSIPNYIFNAPLDVKLSFLAGMIDADGYINSKNKNFSVIQLGSINKEMSLQTMYLMEMCGFKDVKIYKNYYKRGSKKIRYRVECKVHISDIATYMSSEKKKAHIKPMVIEREHDNNTLKVTNIEFVKHNNVYTYDVTTSSDMFDVSGISSHNCRSMVFPYYENGKYKTWGRFNIGVMTVNLPLIALKSKTKEEFYDNLTKAMDVIKVEQLKVAEDLANSSSDVAPMLWNYGAFSRLPKGEKLRSLIYGGYSTCSIGYAGVAEAVQRFGTDYLTKEGQTFGLDIVDFMDSYCKKAREETDLGFSLYGTPLESTTQKFAKSLKAYPEIKGVNDRDYITNSYHVPVYRNIDAFSKLDFEAPFQEYSAGGAISYIEVPDVSKNVPAVIKVMQYIYDHIMYAEINTRNNDVCYECGYEGEMENYERLKWRCPQCGNTNKSKMSVVRRTLE